MEIGIAAHSAFSYRAQATPAMSAIATAAAFPYNAPMRLLLQQAARPGEAPCFVQLSLQPDLFGGWTLLRESSRQGKSQLKRHQFDDREAALCALKKLRDTHLKKGFTPLPAPGSNIQTEIPWP